MSASADVPNWVAERARCNLVSKFDDLFDRVVQDVREINKLSALRRDGHVFETDRNDDSPVPSFLVYWYLEGDPADRSADQVRFTRNTTSMSFQLPASEKTQIVPKWNDADTVCELFIDSEKLPIWRISQRALGEFFFSVIGDR